MAIVSALFCQCLNDDFLFVRCCVDGANEISRWRDAVLQHGIIEDREQCCEEVVFNAQRDHLRKDGSSPPKFQAVPLTTWLRSRDEMSMRMTHLSTFSGSPIAQQYSTRLCMTSGGSLAFNSFEASLFSSFSRKTSFTSAATNLEKNSVNNT